MREDLVFGLVRRGAPGAPPVPGTEQVLTSRERSVCVGMTLPIGETYS